MELVFRDFPVFPSFLIRPKQGFLPGELEYLYPHPSPFLLFLFRMSVVSYVRTLFDEVHSKVHHLSTRFASRIRWSPGTLTFCLSSRTPTLLSPTKSLLDSSLPVTPDQSEPSHSDPLKSVVSLHLFLHSANSLRKPLWEGKTPFLPVYPS